MRDSIQSSPLSSHFNNHIDNQGFNDGSNRNTSNGLDGDGLHGLLHGLSVPVMSNFSDKFSDNSIQQTGSEDDLLQRRKSFAENLHDVFTGNTNISRGSPSPRNTTLNRFVTPSPPATSPGGSTADTTPKTGKKKSPIRKSGSCGSGSEFSDIDFSDMADSDVGSVTENLLSVDGRNSLLRCDRKSSSSKMGSALKKLMVSASQSGEFQVEDGGGGHGIIPVGEGDCAVISVDEGPRGVVVESRVEGNVESSQGDEQDTGVSNSRRSNLFFSAAGIVCFLGLAGGLGVLPFVTIGKDLEEFRQEYKTERMVDQKHVMNVEEDLVNTNVRVDEVGNWDGRRRCFVLFGFSTRIF